MHPHSPTHCPHCQAAAPTQPSRLVRYTVVFVAWIVAMAGVFGSALLGPVNIPMLPFFIPISIIVVSAAHTWAFPDVICDTCGKLILLGGELMTAEQPEPMPATSPAPPAIAA